MKVILATDGSAHAQHAENFTVKLLGAGNLDLNVVTVCPSGDLHSMGFEFPVGIHNMVDECRQRSNEVLQGVSSRLATSVRSLDTHILDGHPASEILWMVEESKPDLTVVGSHGWTATERFLLGSVSDRVAKYAQSSVLITRARENDFSRSECSHILIADDGSEAASAAVDRIAQLTLPESCAITLVALIMNPSATGIVLPTHFQNVMEEAQHEAAARLANHAEKFAGKVGTISQEIHVSVSISSDLVKLAREKEADLIVMGGKKKSMIERLLLGSTSVSVLHNAPCSVWIER